MFEGLDWIIEKKQQASHTLAGLFDHIDDLPAAFQEKVAGLRQRGEAFQAMLDQLKALRGRGGDSMTANVDRTIRNGEAIKKVISDAVSAVEVAAQNIKGFGMDPLSGTPILAGGGIAAVTAANTAIMTWMADAATVLAQLQKLPAMAMGEDGQPLATPAIKPLLPANAFQNLGLLVIGGMVMYFLWKKFK